ncbi:MAG: hypothetical protein ACRCZF_23395, partial [Gemmataceae bacterium]
MSTSDEPFRSVRPDGKGPNEPYAAPVELKTLSEKDLRARRHEVEKQLYWSRHEPGAGGPSARASDEKQWNDMNAALREKQGRTWVYKHDRRDEYTFRQETVITSDKMRRTNTFGEGRVYPPESTIQWRSRENTY